MVNKWRMLALVVVAVLLLQLAIGAVAANAQTGYGGYGYGYNAPIYHVVKRGETLASIGRLYGVSMWAIARNNNIQNPNYIQAGWVLLIPQSGGWNPQPTCPWWCYSSGYGYGYGQQYSGYYQNYGYSGNQGNWSYGNYGRQGRWDP